MRGFWGVFAAVLVLGFAGLSFGEIGWCGNIWPLDGAEVTAGEDLNVYFQIWKEGVTDSASDARGCGLSATLYYRVAGETDWTPVEMHYNVDVGNNDEYMGTIPGSALVSGTSVEVYCEAYDSTDGTTCQGNDQSGNPATETDPLTYVVITPTTRDVTVHFSVNMNGVDEIVEPVSVAGTFTGWDDSPVALSDPDSDGIYEGSVVIPAGSSRHQEYKYIMGSGIYIWEECPNRVFEVEDTLEGDQYLPLDYWSNLSTRDITVVFRVDMSGWEVTDPYIAGNQPPLHWGWDDGWTDADRIYDDGTHCDEVAGDSIYTTAITFPRGTYRDIEYKFTTDGTDNEPLPPYQNHRFTLTEDSDTLWLPVVVFGELGTGIKETPLPETPVVVSVKPNPFNSAARIEVFVEKNLSSPGILQIYDASGRIIKTLARGISAPGRYSFLWDGTDSDNYAVPSGTYFYRFRFGDRAVSGAVVLIR